MVKNIIVTKRSIINLIKVYLRSSIGIHTRQIVTIGKRFLPPEVGLGTRHEYTYSTLVSSH